MLTKFWAGLGGKLAERWMDLLFSPAFFFWAGGAIAVIPLEDWPRLKQAFLSLDVAPQGALLVALLLLLMVSSSLAAHLSLPVLRILEGYWPGFFSWPAAFLRRRQRNAQNARMQRWVELKNMDEALLTAEQCEEFLVLDERVMEPPLDERYIMPTRLGNILRGAELKPRERFGLDAVVCWPRLWLLLPDNVRGELWEARANLDKCARLWLWGFLFSLWAWCNPWSIAAALPVMYYAYLRALACARIYGMLVVAVYELHRFDLYKAFRWPAPTNPSREIAHGLELSKFLWRGSDSRQPTYVDI